MAKIFTVSSTTIAFWIRNLSLSALLLGSLSYPSWADVKTAEIVGAPTVEEDRITVRIKVTDEGDRPVIGLDETHFGLQVDGKPFQFKSQDWKSPEEAVLPPAWIIVLLDMSGSMGNPDSRGTTKLAGALAAIKAFKDAIAARASNLPNANIPQIAIVPFGKPGQKCEGFAVDRAELDKFFPANDFKLQNHLNFLAQKTPCAATNLYEPLTKAVRFLGNGADSRFSAAEDAPQPRLGIILLSDGYHTEAKEAEDFQALRSLLKRHSQLTVHTLGYGLTLEELGAKYNLGRPATRGDISEKTPLPKGKVPADEFVDQIRLQEISQLTGGISEFSGDAESIADKLQVFLNALLGEYEISYSQVGAERGAQHRVQVVVTSPAGTAVESAAKDYRITNFGRSLPLSTRLGIGVATLLILVGAGGIPFWVWAQQLKREAL